MASSRPADRDARAPAGRRLTPEARERQIVVGAIDYFAEVGLDGHTRELARRLGITQPLLFRYFPTKAALIERIYEEVYLKRWDPGWEATVRDTALPCLERFRRFEIDYQHRIDDYAWLRIFVSAGLKGFDLPSRYLGMVRERIFAPLLAGMRAEVATCRTHRRRRCPTTSSSCCSASTAPSSMSACARGSTGSTAPRIATGSGPRCSTRPCRACSRPIAGWCWAPASGRADRAGPGRAPAPRRHEVRRAGDSVRRARAAPSSADGSMTSARTALALRRGGAP